MARPFKYQSYLDKYKECPKNCKEQDLIAFRWVHETPDALDFCPILANPNIPARVIDNDDRGCTGYALSLYKDLDSAVASYMKSYERIDRKSKLEKFKREKGTFTAKINIIKDDGVSDTPKEGGHFNFFEYADSALLKGISEIIDTFAYYGTSKEI